jgi:hypothetical protein
VVLRLSAYTNLTLNHYVCNITLQVANDNDAGDFESPRVLEREVATASAVDATNMVFARLKAETLYVVTLSFNSVSLVPSTIFALI